jgi:hypothetical protein
MRRAFAVGIAAALWGISWYFASFTGFGAFLFWHWKWPPLVVVALAVLTLVLAVGGPILGVWIGRSVWRSTPVEELPPGWGQRPPED